MDKKMNPDLRSRLPELRVADGNEKELRHKFYKNKAETVVKNMIKNGFDACYADSLEEAADLLYDLIPQEATVGCGDSHTLFAMNVEDRLREEKHCDIISHRVAVNNDTFDHPTVADEIIGTREEMRELLIRYLTSDVFILGANAITLDGQIVNVDGRGNRVVGGIYGPDRIIVVAGANKIARNLEEARARVGFVAAPINNLKYGQEPPCLKTGDCKDCYLPTRICNVTTVIHRKPENSDYHVILIGEEVGF